MTFFVKLAAAAGLAALTFAALPSGAEAQYRGGPSGHYGQSWNGPEGYFQVNARACPDLLEDYRDRRSSYGRRGGRGDWRDRRVLDCPTHAWTYVPSYRERRMGRTGDSLRPDVAYFDRRSGRYEVQTRWGDVPVEVVWDRGVGFSHGLQVSVWGHRGRRH